LLSRRSFASVVSDPFRHQLAGVSDAGKEQLVVSEWFVLALLALLMAFVLILIALFQGRAVKINATHKSVSVETKESKKRK